MFRKMLGVTVSCVSVCGLCSISRSVVRCAKCGRVVGRSGTNKSVNLLPSEVDCIGYVRLCMYVCLLALV